MKPALRLASLLLVMAMAVASCASQPQSQAPGGGGTLTRAMTSEPADLDPQGPANSGLSLVLPYLFDTLITKQKDGALVGQLAESWQVSQDGRTIDFVLKPGVKFHDGSKLDASAVVFTFERFKQTGQKSPIASDIGAISSVKAVDERTVRFVLARPLATFLSTITMPYAGILSPAATQAAGAQMGLKPVGSGPFKLSEWKRGVSINLARNPDYNWGSPEVQNRGPVRFESLVFKVVPDANTQLAALQAGEIDVMLTNEPGHLAKLEADKSVRVERVNLEALIFLGYNCAKPPFDDVRVRQALSHAVDKTQIVQTALGGLGAVANTPLMPSMLGYNPDLGSYGQSYDPSKAKTLLLAAGFTQAADGSWQRDGKKLAGKLLTSSRAPNEAIATVLQSQLKAIGVPVEIQQLDSAAVQTATNEGAFDLLLWRFEWTDSDGLSIFLASSRIRQTNRVFYSNKSVDSLFERGQSEYDSAKRSQIYQDAQKVILAEAPWQPLYSPIEGMAIRNRVTGIKIGSLGRMLVNDVTLDGR
jgi:peptide/nickel transport system substrate-binding protein